MSDVRLSSFSGVDEAESFLKVASELTGLVSWEAAARELVRVGGASQDEADDAIAVVFEYDSDDYDESDEFEMSEEQLDQLDLLAELADERAQRRAEEHQW